MKEYKIKNPKVYAQRFWENRKRDWIHGVFKEENGGYYIRSNFRKTRVFNGQWIICDGEFGRPLRSMDHGEFAEEFEGVS